MEKKRVTKGNGVDVTLDQIRERNRAELQGAIRSLRRPDEKNDAAWWRIGAKLGIPKAWVRRLEYGYWPDPPGSLVDYLRMKIKAVQAAEIADLEPSLTQILTQMQTLRGRLDAIDPDFHSLDVEALGAAARPSGKDAGLDD